jgi:L-lactate dehydrogenase (cytochrome)
MGTLRLAPATVSDYRRLAESPAAAPAVRLHRRRSVDERTLAANREDLARLRLRQRVLRDVSQIDTTAEIAGRTAAMPVAFAPVGLAGLMRRRGEVQAARAAEAAGVPFCLSTVGLCSLEEVRAATKAPFWFSCT